MSIFSGLFKSRDKPKNNTPGSAYRFYLGEGKIDREDRRSSSDDYGTRPCNPLWQRHWRKRLR